MKIYEHTGPGHYIGSRIAIISETRETAEEIIRKILNKSGLSREDLNIREIEIKDGVVVVEEDGDY